MLRHAQITNAQAVAMLSGLFSTNSTFIELKVVKECITDVDDAFSKIRSKAVDYLS